MTFIAMIIALLLLQAWGSGDRVHRDEWFEAVSRRLVASGLPAGVGIALAVLAPAVLAQLALESLASVLFGLPWIALAVFLLLYAMGRRDFRALLDRYRHQCRHGDFEGAYLTTLAELGWTTLQDDPRSPREVHRLVQRGFLYEGYQRWFAVLFYFVLLGPAGALAYRLLHLARDHFDAGLVERCLWVVDWIPVRLLAAAFSLTGDFVGSRDELMEGIADLQVAAPDMLQEVGRASLDMDQTPVDSDVDFGAVAAREIDETASLLFRSGACWLVAISLIVLLT
jgi:AmpE protein